MAGTQLERNFKEQVFHVLGDWVAPFLAFLTVVGIMFALVSVLIESAR